MRAPARTCRFESVVRGSFRKEDGRNNDAADECDVHALPSKQIKKEKMSKSLVIVESPAKAKTINKYLGKDFEVEASFGHIMDLPKRDIGVELEHRTFEPTLVVSPDKEKVVQKLRKMAQKADAVFLAPDPD